MSNAVKIFGIVKFPMKEFDCDFDYKQLDFTDEETKLYRIGRGESKSSLVRLLYRRHLGFIGDSELDISEVK